MKPPRNMAPFPGRPFLNTLLRVVHVFGQMPFSRTEMIPMTSASADRNKAPILEMLRKYLGTGEQQLVLEIACGTGQHLAHFAGNFPNATFLPTDMDSHLLKSTDAHREKSGLSNILKAAYVDVSEPFSKWSVPEIVKPGSVDLILNSNMIHISSTAAIKGLFEAAGHLLVKQKGVLFTYGPYSIDGVISPQSNINFDQKLRNENADWGLRDTTLLSDLASQNGLKFENMFDMPANNKVLIFRRL